MCKLPFAPSYSNWEHLPVVVGFALPTVWLRDAGKLVVGVVPHADIGAGSLTNPEQIARGQVTK
jgi:hypothetical protein